tara:strand:+ start:161 stop:511 length:351 start_codon:yes stop_codon:yes gene_type:complete
MSVEKICRVPEGSVFRYDRTIGERMIWKSRELHLEINPGIPNLCLIGFKEFVFFHVKKCPLSGMLEMYIQYSQDNDDFDEETAYATIKLQGTPAKCYTLTAWHKKYKNAYKITFNK